MFLGLRKAWWDSFQKWRLKTRYRKQNKTNKVWIMRCKTVGSKLTRDHPPIPQGKMPLTAHYLPSVFTLEEGPAV